MLAFLVESVLVVAKTKDNKSGTRSRKTTSTGNTAVVKQQPATEPVHDPNKELLGRLENLGAVVVDLNDTTNLRDLLARRLGIKDHATEIRSIKELVDRMLREGAEESAERRRTMVRAALAHAPDDYAACQKLVADLSHVFRREIAEVLGPRLNDVIKAMPQETYVEKQALASWVNNELRQLGLAIRDEKTRRPAILVADVKGGVESPSRFRFEVREDNGTKTRTFTSRTLPTLELMEDKVRSESFARQSRK